MKPARSLVPAAAPSTTRCPTTAEIREYMPLVHQTVARFLRRLPPNVLRDDLVAAGMIGLVDSLRKNGGDTGAAFEWYARIRIRGAIFDELRAQDWLTRRARDQATAASEDGTSTGRASVVGFDDLSTKTSMAMFVDESAQSPLDAIEQKMDRARVAEAIAKLPERERYIVQAHYFDGIQFKEIAAKLGVSEPRVSQLRTRAVGLLRAAMTEAA